MDLTIGSIRKKLILCALPLILSSVLQQSFSMVDTMIISHYCSAQALSAVSLASMPYSLLVVLLMGFGVGCSMVIGKVFGQKDWKLLKNAVVSLLLTGGGLGAILAIACILFSRPYLIWTKTPAAILDLTTAVLRTYALGLFFYGFGLIASALLNGLGYSRQTLMISAFSGISNIVLDLIAVFYFKAGIMGCVIASLMAQFYSLIHSLYLLHQIAFKDTSAFQFQKTMMLESFQIGSTSMIQGAMQNLLGILVQAVINPFGIDYINGYNTGLLICSIFTMAINGYCTGYAAMLSQNYGAQKTERMQEAKKVSLQDGLILCLFISIVSFLFSKQLCVFILTASSETSIQFGSFYILSSIPSLFINLYTQRISHLLRLYHFNKQIIIATLLTIFIKIACLYPFAAVSIYLIPFTDIVSRLIGVVYLGKQRQF